jgi:transcription initiation factor TFIIH subunit 1
MSVGDVQFTLPQVNHQKQPGTIELSMTHLKWSPDMIGEVVLVEIQKVKRQKISPDGKSKVQIQLELTDGRSLTFHFADEDPKATRNKVKAHLGKLMGKVLAKKVDKNLEERKRVLQNNPNLVKLYKQLVTTGQVTAEEFWSSRAHMLDSSHEQDIGITADFLSEVKPQSDGTNSIRYNLTPEIVKVIFRTYPAVKKRYLEVCPTELSEKDFWTQEKVKLGILSMSVFMMILSRYK